MGVNAKRVNWFAERLGALPGWETSPVLAKGHEEYFSLNGGEHARLSAPMRLPSEALHICVAHQHIRTTSTLFLSVQSS